MIHEPTIFATPSFSRGVDRASEAITCSKNSGWPLSAVQSHLAIGRGVHNLAEATEIAGLHYTNAHEWVKRFQRSGISGLWNLPRPGRPKIYGNDPETLVIQTATSRPPDLGLGFTTWSLAKLEAHLRQRSSLKSLSRETIRRILARHGLRFLTGQTWCESNDPDFEVKKTPL
jgi:transposase